VNPPPHILAVGVVDELGIRNASGLDVSWGELGVEAPGNGRTLRAVFGTGDSTFRRLDRVTRALVLAARASGVERMLTPGELERTALVVETSRGSLESDLRYARSLARGVVRAALFPYTLPSTCLGDVALRLATRGPTLSFSIESGDEGEALREARRLLAGGEASFAVAGAVDALDEALDGAPPLLRAVVALVAPASPRFPEVARWSDEGEDPFAVLACACQARPAPGRVVGS
jgi:hypothetical protein